MLNVKGFPGVIEVRESTVKKNMIAIAYMYPNQEGLEKNFSLFEESIDSVITMRAC